MSVQEFQQIPDPYSSYLQHNEADLKTLYPAHIRYIINSLDLDIFKPLVSERLILLLTGNYLPSTHKDYHFDNPTHILESRIRNFRYDVATFDHDELEEKLEEFRNLFTTRILPDLEISNQRNFQTYKKSGPHNLAVELKKSNAYDLRANRFFKAFLHYSCYASPKDKLEVLAQAVKIGKHVIQECGSWRVQYFTSNCEICFCFAYFEQRIQEDAWALPIRSYQSDLDSNFDLITTPKDFAEYGMFIITKTKVNHNRNPVLRNILIELEPLIRSTMALAFASITHPRLGMDSPLNRLEPAIVRRILESADYYGPLLRNYGPSPRSV